MTINGLLPIGSVVLLKGSTKRVMVIGLCQVVDGDNGTRQIYDYAGCPFPEGFISADKNYLFNNDHIDRLFAIGLQDTEELEFKEKADELMKKVREENKAPDAEA